MKPTPPHRAKAQRQSETFNIVSIFFILKFIGMCLQFTTQVSILNQQNNKKSKLLIFKGFKKVLWYLIIYRYGQKYIHKFVQHTGFK